MYFNALTYFKTPEGREIREQFFAQPENQKCYICGKRTHLVPHHLCYDHLGEELLYGDLVALCNFGDNGFDSCHYRVHWKLSGEKIPIKKDIMLKRIRLLKYTNSIRKFRPSTFLSIFFPTP